MGSNFKNSGIDFWKFWGLEWDSLLKSLGSGLNFEKFINGTGIEFGKKNWDWDWFLKIFGLGLGSIFKILGLKLATILGSIFRNFGTCTRTEFPQFWDRDWNLKNSGIGNEINFLYKGFEHFWRPLTSTQRLDFQRSNWVFCRTQWPQAAQFQRGGRER